LISKYCLTIDEYLALTDEFNIGSEIELTAHNLIFHDSPSRVHEHVSVKFERSVSQTYDDDNLSPWGSASTPPDTSPSLTLAIVYDDENGNAKQPDQSYTPRNLPKPSHQNRLKL
jgi:hypothetical protein